MTDEMTSKGTTGGKAPVPSRVADVRIPVTVKGQKYVAPAGRHSQQTHRLAEERAAAAGNANEKEQHAFDRSTLVTEQNRLADQKNKQKQQSDQNKQSTPKAQAE